MPSFTLFFFSCKPAKVEPRLFILVMNYYRPNCYCPDGLMEDILGDDYVNVHHGDHHQQQQQHLQQQQHHGQEQQRQLFQFQLQFPHLPPSVNLETLTDSDVSKDEESSLSGALSQDENRPEANTSGDEKSFNKAMNEMDASSMESSENAFVTTSAAPATSAVTANTHKMEISSSLEHVGEDRGNDDDIGNAVVNSQDPTSEIKLILDQFIMAKNSQQRQKKEEKLHQQQQQRVDGGHECKVADGGQKAGKTRSCTNSQVTSQAESNDKDDEPSSPPALSLASKETSPDLLIQMIMHWMDSFQDDETIQVSLQYL